jgi:hypothetical protein
MNMTPSSDLWIDFGYMPHTCGRTELSGAEINDIILSSIQTPYDVNSFAAKKYHGLSALSILTMIAASSGLFIVSMPESCSDFL